MISLATFSFTLALQLLVVVSSDWNATEGNLYRYERTPTTAWEAVGSPIPVTLGKKGMAWGLGLHDMSNQTGLVKKEGDRKCPAGLFAIGPAFGDAQHQSYAVKIPFLLVTDDLECVDDGNSRYYNQFVYANSIQNRDWNSSEKMKEIGPMYALGLVIQHNLDPIQVGMGSAIFMHIWENEGVTTTGCTAMAEGNLNEIVSWLNIENQPCIVQLPLDEYLSKKAQWGLPELPETP